MTFKISITKRGEAKPFWSKAAPTREGADRIAANNQRLIDAHGWEHTVEVIEEDPNSVAHCITGIEQRTTPEDITLFRWACACGRHGKWTTLRRAHAAAARHTRRYRSAQLSPASTTFTRS